MPFYEYCCSSCKHQDTILESFSAARTKKCPNCNKRSFTRLISAAAFHLKGDGWYVTDFRDKKNNAEDSAKGDKNGDKNGGKDGGKSGENNDGKPAKKDDGKPAKKDGGEPTKKDGKSPAKTGGKSADAVNK